MSKKFEKNMIVAVPETLFKDFKESCEKRYTTMSQVVRDFMLQYTKGYKNENKKNN